MPLQHYGVLKGRAVAARREEGTNTPHYQVHIAADTTDYRIAVNVRSKSTPSELLFLVNDQFEHVITAQLADLPLGWNPLPSQAGGVALDYIRANLVKQQDMRHLPSSLPGPDNDLSDQLEHYVQRAIDEAGALVYAFGQRWGPETKSDKVFGFNPGNGVHDIHMNQGNVEPFVDDDGVWQDGGLLFHFPSSEQWAAIFLAFQSQAWHTDDVNGHTTAEPSTNTTTTTSQIPTGEEPHGLIRIVAAMANSIQSPEVETVTLLNVSPQTVNLAGWALADKNKNKFTLGGFIAAGDALKVTIAPPMQLSNKGGIITVLNEQGLKVDGVSYTQQQANEPGWSIVF